MSKKRYTPKLPNKTDTCNLKSTNIVQVRYIKTDISVIKQKNLMVSNVEQDILRHFRKNKKRNIVKKKKKEGDAVITACMQVDNWSIYLFQ